MKYLKINLEDQANLEKIADLLLHLRGVKSVEVIDDSLQDSDLKKALNKGKQQLKNGDFESIVSDIFDILGGPSKPAKS